MNVITESIESRWITEKGRWDKGINDFIDRKETEQFKTIKMKINHRNDGDILKFIGGPTGFESYYVSDLLKNNNDNKEICICAGTINRWSACYVNRKKVFDFINNYSI